MTALNKQALREAANAANIASWGKWESYKPHKGARGYEVKVGAKAVAQHCLKVDSAFIAADNPVTMLALLDELETAEHTAAVDHEAACSLVEENEEVKRKLAAAEKRIAELEARTVTLEPFRSFVTDADITALHRFAECCDDPESGGHDLEKEQVRRLEAIGALQRSGRISYITGFGDVLISITSDIGKGD